MSVEIIQAQTKVDSLKAELKGELDNTIRKLENVLENYIDMPHKFLSSDYGDALAIRVEQLDGVTGNCIFGADFSVSFDFRNGLEINHGCMGPFSVFNNSQVNRLRVMNNICTNALEVDEQFRTIIKNSNLSELKQQLSKAKVDAEFELYEFIDKVAGEIEVGMQFVGYSRYGDKMKGETGMTVTKLTPKRVHVTLDYDVNVTIDRRTFAENIYNKVYDLINNPNVVEDN